MDVAPYLYCAIDDSVKLDLHMQHILYDYVICECGTHYFGYQEVIHGYALR
jgi:hypothetical protein